MASNRLGKLASRRTDPAIYASKAFEVYDRIAEDESVKYAIGAMQPVEPEYTSKTIEEGNRVRAQIQKAFLNTSTVVEFAYQGSVTSDTHIKAHSDIDLLAIYNNFHYLQPPAVPPTPYDGDPFADMRRFRKECVDHLRTAFPAVFVDASPGKCIALSGGSLQREIDVVLSNWWDTVEYQQSGLRDDRGVKIFDSEKNMKIENKPFRHNNEIDEKDNTVSGGLRKVIRLLKSLRYDADTEVRISSYDIAALAWNMPTTWLITPYEKELLLVENAHSFLKYVLENDTYRTGLGVPNGMRKIFGSEGASVAGLRQLHEEVEVLLNDINQGLSRSFKKLADARIKY